MSNPTPDENAPPSQATSPEGAPSAAEEANTQAALVDLANSMALLPQAPPAEGEEAQPEGAISLPVIEQDGNRYVPVFTTEDALVAAGEILAPRSASPSSNWPLTGRRTICGWRSIRPRRRGSPFRPTWCGRCRSSAKPVRRVVGLGSRARALWDSGAERIARRPWSRQEQPRPASARTGPGSSRTPP